MAKIIAELNAASLPLAAGDLWRLEQNGLPVKITKAQMVTEIGGAEINDLTVVVTWANVPNANITVGSVTQHEAALTILESQITDGSILARVGVDANFDALTATSFGGIASGDLLDKTALETISNNWEWSQSSTALLVPIDVVNTNDAGGVELQIRGSGQGDGYLFVGQSTTFGGGVAYRGDGTSPKAMANAGADRVTFYRRSSGADTEVFSYPQNSDAIRFRGTIAALAGIDFNDNIELRFGTGNDAAIDFDGANWVLRLGGERAIVARPNSSTDLFYNDILSLRSASRTASDIGMGAEVLDGDNGFRPVGMNVSLPAVKNSAYTFILADNGQTMRQTDTTNRVWTVPNDANIPVGAMYGLAITGTGGVDLTGATGVTVIHFDASTAGGNSKTAGVHVLSDPCAGSLHKITDTLWHLFADNAA